MLSRSEPRKHDPHAKKPNNSNTAERNLARIDGFYRQTAEAPPASPALSTFRPGDHGPKSIVPIPWCTGEDSNLRSSKERQIYSLLPLTARPPVHNSKTRGAARSTPTHSADAFPRRSQKKPGRQFGMIAAGYSGPKLWSWRRDLNPRPSDYKSDALPAELRQPEQPCSLPPTAGSQLPRLPQNPANCKRAAGANPGAIIPRLMRVVNRTLHAQAH